MGGICKKNYGKLPSILPEPRAPYSWAGPWAVYELRTVCIPTSMVTKSIEVESRVAKLRLDCKTLQCWTMGIKILFQDCLFLSSNVFRKTCQCNCFTTTQVMSWPHQCHIIYWFKMDKPNPNARLAVCHSVGVSVWVQYILAVAGFPPLQKGRRKQDNHFSVFFSPRHLSPIHKNMHPSTASTQRVPSPVCICIFSVVSKWFVGCTWKSK